MLLIDLHHVNLPVPGTHAKTRQCIISRDADSIDSRLEFTWKVGWAEPAVMQSPRIAYPIGAWGRQKVTHLSLPSTCTSQLEAAAWG